MWRRNREVRMGHRGLRAIVHVQPPLRRLWKFVCLWIVRPESSLSVHRVACPGIFRYELLFLATSSVPLSYASLCWCALLYISYGNRLDRRWCFKIPKSKKLQRERKHFLGSKKHFLIDCCFFCLFASLPLARSEPCPCLVLVYGLWSALPSLFCMMILEK